MAHDLLGIKADGAHRQLEGAVEVFARAAHLVHPTAWRAHGQLRVRQGIVGIEGDGLLEQLMRYRRGRRVVDRQRVAAQHALVGRQARRRAAPQALGRRRLESPGKCRGDGAHHLVLDREDLLRRAVVALGPQSAYRPPPRSIGR